MTKDQQIAELKRRLKAADYERGFLQQRLDLIRGMKDKIVFLLDTPTLQEHLAAGGGFSDWMGVGRKIG